MIKQKEIEKIRKNPRCEIRKRIKEVLSGNFEIHRINIDNVVFNDLHSIHGTVSNNGNFFKFNIAKKVC